MIKADLTNVAEVAWVSAATASRVLSGRGPASAASRERVLPAAAALGYPPHPMARMLARGGGIRLVLAVRDARRASSATGWPGCSPAVVASGWSLPSGPRGRAAAGRILLRWPDTDAIVAVGDAAAVGVLDALAGRGVGEPDDVAVTGFDDAGLAGAVRPALSTATRPVERIAAAAARAGLGDPPGAGLFPRRPVLRQTA